MSDLNRPRSVIRHRLIYHDDCERHALFDYDCAVNFHFAHLPLHARTKHHGQFFYLQIIFPKPNRQKSFRHERNNSILARVVDLSDVRPRENFSRHVEQEREEPFAIGVENFFPRDENFVLKARVGIRRDVEGVQIIGLLAREMFFKNFLSLSLCLFLTLRYFIFCENFFYKLLNDHEEHRN